MHLNKPKLFITFIFKDFAEKWNVVILVVMELDAVDQGNCPFNDEGF